MQPEWEEPLDNFSNRKKGEQTTKKLSKITFSCCLKLCFTTTFVIQKHMSMNLKLFFLCFNKQFQLVEETLHIHLLRIITFHILNFIMRTNFKQLVSISSFLIIITKRSHHRDPYSLWVYTHVSSVTGQCNRRPMNNKHEKYQERLSSLKNHKPSLTRTVPQF